MDREIEVTTVRPGDSTNYPVKGSSVRVHYEGYLVSDESKFDSSRVKGRAFEFRVGEGQVIDGWDEAVVKMSRGQIARIKIPFEKGYGLRGYPPIIPPSADLLFEIELISFTAP